MKPTRHIPKLNKGLWTPKRNVWFKKNDDGHKVEIVDKEYPAIKNIYEDASDEQIDEFIRKGRGGKV